ncbi:InlB B-repeat-containing protein [Sediminitomix flava]|uniref:Putative repeat protein (TIGR02543 family)/predicted secreted protein (Por secretion system target) n=1 Tax=Sediminitomix flava TaxID=379075 RepID=A0A315ZBE6_SEDFL|nr:InlB B-repeat-containing protein [Sediminitomix flava]PWJ42906.1 putative repeat protein (TIGR02543 family)/predicted secreted protein (Por secretion system target) [Sediminitomix flava]
MRIFTKMGLILFFLGYCLNFSNAFAENANLALNKTAVASSGNAAEAVDGNGTSRWESDFDDDQWLQVDLGESYDLNRVILNWEGAFGKAYEIQVSEDETTWTTVFTETEGNGEIDELLLSGTGRYVKMQGVERGTGYGYSLWEMEVYGVPAGQSPAVYAIAYADAYEHSNPATYTAGTAVTLTNASREGYVFEGWFTDMALTQPISEIGTDSQANIWLYAKWSEDANAPQNIALGKTTTASSGDGALAVDGNETSRWESAFNDDQWLYIDLGAKYDVNRVLLNWEGAFGKIYDIQISDDATNWTTIFSETESDGGIDDLEVTGSGRYVKMLGIERALPYGYSLWEMEVYGTLSDDQGSMVYNVTYVDGYDHTNPATYTEGVGVTLTDASRTGYTFEGWFTDVELTQSISEITAEMTGDLTVYAKWTEEENSNTACNGVSTEVVEGDALSLGFNYNFATTGTTVDVTFELLDEQVGVVAFLFNRTDGFVETQMAENNGVFSVQLTEQVEGTVLTLACKFAYAGGFTITKDFTYTVGDDCGEVVEGEYSITYVDGYDHTNPATYTEGIGMTLTDASRTGYTFEGWFTDVELTQSISEITAEMTGDLTVYAKWTEEENSNTACNGVSTEVVEGDALSLGYNYNFVTTGTTVDVTFELLDEQVGVVAFLFNRTDGFVETQMAENNGVFSVQLTEQVEGTALTLACKFAYAGGFTITKDFTYTVGDDCGEVVEGEYSITYVDGYDHTNPATYTEGVGMTLTDASRTGYTFEGWFTDAELTQSISEITAEMTGDLTVYAKWTEEENSNTACNGVSTEVVEGDALSLGYNYNFATTGTTVDVTFELLDEQVGVVAFLFNRTDGFVETQMAENNGVFSVQLTEQVEGTALTLACKFAYAGGFTITKDFTYTVGDDCEEVVEVQSSISYVDAYDHANPATYTEGIGVTLADASREGYTFEGWFTDAEFTQSISEITAEMTGDLTLYAKWQMIPEVYNITYVDAHTHQNPATYTEGESVELLAASRTNYDFEGWFTDDAYTQVITSISTDMTGDLTLYAKWSTILSSNEREELSVRIYPNPVVDYLLVEALVSSLKVYTLEGTLVSSFENNQERYDLSSLQTGVYIVHIVSEGRTYYQKIVKQ